MPTKGNGEGTIFFNKQRKKWNAQYKEYDVKTGTMKPKTKSFKTEEEAKKYLSVIMYQKENPLFIEHNGIPLCEIMKSNLKLKLDTNQISPTQFGRVLKTIEQIEKQSVSTKNVDKITSDEIQEYLNSLQYLSNSSIKKVYQQFNQAFKIAMNKGYIMQNPMINVIQPKSIKEDKIVRALTVDEQQAFTEYLLSKDLEKCKYKNVFLLQMYLGLRVSEALALTMHDIDLRTKRINIHRTLTTDENNLVIMGNKTKTYSGKRIVPIPEFLYPHIIEQMKVSNNMDNNDEKLLFKPNNSKYTKRENVNLELKRILKKELNVTDISTHSLRHTYGTRCIEARCSSCCSSKVNGA